MCEDGHDLVLAALFDEGVVEDDALVLEEAVHVGVAVRAARGPVHHKQLGERELQRPGQLLYRCPAVHFITCKSIGKFQRGDSGQAQNVQGVTQALIKHRSVQRSVHDVHMSCTVLHKQQ